jgi:transposase
MRGRRSALSIHLTDQTRRTLQSWLHRRKTPYGRAKRARALLLLEQGETFVQTAQRVGLTESHIRKWAKRFLEQGVVGLAEKPQSGRPPLFAPEVALHIVKPACERPDSAGRSLSQWNCPDLVRQLKADGLVQNISAETVRSLLPSHKLRPWRHHLWLSAKVPRDEQFAKQVQEIAQLYTHPLAQWDIVLCLDEKTNLQPRPRSVATLPTRSGLPTRLEHEEERAGALHLFAAFETRTGSVTALTALRKRQKEFLSLLAKLDRETPARVKRIFLVLDNASIQKGKQVQTWLQSHPRFVCFFVPVHCSWMNQVEQWFSILQRKRLRISDFTDRDQLADRLMSFVAEWNTQAHPFKWSTQSVAKVLAKSEAQPIPVPVL